MVLIPHIEAQASNISAIILCTLWMWYSSDSTLCGSVAICIPKMFLIRSGATFSFAEGKDKCNMSGDMGSPARLYQVFTSTSGIDFFQEDDKSKISWSLLFSSTSQLCFWELLWRRACEKKYCALAGSHNYLAEKIRSAIILSWCWVIQRSQLQCSHSYSGSTLFILYTVEGIIKRKLSMLTSLILQTAKAIKLSFEKDQFSQIAHSRGDND